MITRFFGWRPFVLIGQVSYEAYLIHTVVILGILEALPHLHAYPMMAIDVAIIAVISSSFYYLVEQPIRRRGWRAVLLRRSGEDLGSVAGPALAFAAPRHVHLENAGSSGQGGGSEGQPSGGSHQRESPDRP